MPSSVSLVPRSNDQTYMMSLTGAQELGDLLARSGFFQDARDAAQAAVKVMAGAEMGFGPIASMTGIYIVKGRVTMGANLIAAAVRRSGRYQYRLTEHDDQHAVIDFYENGECVGTSTFTIQDATRAGLAGSDNWRKSPRNMLFARAMSNGAKWYCPDIFGGAVYTPDELDATLGSDGDDVWQLPPTPVTPKETAHTPTAEPPAPTTDETPPPISPATEPTPAEPEPADPQPVEQTPDPAAAAPAPPVDLSVAETMEALGIGEVAQRFLLVDAGVEDISGDLNEMYANLSREQVEKVIAAAQQRAQG
jgi:hypothetical protein